MTVCVMPGWLLNGFCCVLEHDGECVDVYGVPPGVGFFWRVYIIYFRCASVVLVKYILYVVSLTLRSKCKAVFVFTR